MKETIIVTLKCESKENDFELPWNVCLKELYPRLKAALINGRFWCEPWGGILLKKDGLALMEPMATLADYGIVSGDLLTVMGKE